MAFKMKTCVVLLMQCFEIETALVITVLLRGMDLIGLFLPPLFLLLWFLFKSRENLSPFTKDFRGEEHIRRIFQIFPALSQG